MRNLRSRLVWTAVVLTVLGEVWWRHPCHLRMTPFASCPDVDPRLTYAIRVLLVRNPRFPAFSAEQHREILRELPLDAKLLLDATIRCEDLGEIPVESFFERYDREIGGRTQVVRPSGSSWQSSVEQSIDLTLQRSRGSKRYLTEFYGVRLDDSTQSERSHGTFWERYRVLEEAVAEDGKSLLHTGDGRFDSFRGWSKCLENTTKVDLVISNDLLHSVELNGQMALHQLLRGGISLGGSCRSRSTHGGTAVVAAYPLLTQTYQFRTWRRGALSQPQESHAAALVAVHELGHLLRNLDDEFAHEHCVMSPTPGLCFQRWMQGIDREGRCHRIHHYRSSYLFAPVADDMVSSKASDRDGRGDR